MISPQMNLQTREKAMENRYRRILHRRGYALCKSRRRDPNSYDYGRYMIVDSENNGCIAGNYPIAFAFDLDDVGQWLEDGD
jgi:hypothetical protein